MDTDRVRDLESLPYLVQRCVLKDDFNPKGGFDANMTFAYMGSAEFEFGALPKSLKRITSQLDRYDIFETTAVDASGRVLKYFAKHRHPNLEEALGKECTQKYFMHTKEAMCLFDSCTKPNPKKGESRNWDYVDVWWDIENDLFWAFGSETMGKIPVMLKNVRERYIQDGTL